MDNNILEKYSKEQLKNFVNWSEPGVNSDWPDDFRDWMKEQMAYELYDRLVNSGDTVQFDYLAKDIIDFYLENN